MDDFPRRKLCDLVLEFNGSLYEDSRICESILKDYCGSFKREVNVLIGALKKQVVVTLLSSSNTTYDIVSARLVKRLCDNLSLTEESAQWAIALKVDKTPEVDKQKANSSCSSESAATENNPNLLAFKG